MNDERYNCVFTLLKTLIRKEEHHYVRSFKSINCGENEQLPLHKTSGNIASVATGERGHKLNHGCPGHGAPKWIFRAGKHLTWHPAKQKPSGYQIVSMLMRTDGRASHTICLNAVEDSATHTFLPASPHPTPPTSHLKTLSHEKQKYQ